MYRWPWRRFEAMFKRHLLRKAREELREMRDLRLAALDANTNFDAEENRDAKMTRMEDLQKAYLAGVKMLYRDPDEQEPDPYGDDPLFNPLKRRAAALSDEINQPLVEQAGEGRRLIER